MPLTTATSAPTRRTTVASLRLNMMPNRRKLSQQPQNAGGNQKAADNRERRAGPGIVGGRDLMENDAKSAKGGDEGGDDGRAECRHSRHVAGINACFGMTAAAVHVAVMAAM